MNERQVLARSGHSPRGRSPKSAKSRHPDHPPATSDLPLMNEDLAKASNPVCGPATGWCSSLFSDLAAARRALICASSSFLGDEQHLDGPSLDLVEVGRRQQLAVMLDVEFGDGLVRL
jgi:hypothetical protein